MLGLEVQQKLRHSFFPYGRRRSGKYCQQTRVPQWHNNFILTSTTPGNPILISPIPAQEADGAARKSSNSGFHARFQIFAAESKLVETARLRGGAFRLQLTPPPLVHCPHRLRNTIFVKGYVIGRMEGLFRNLEFKLKPCSEDSDDRKAQNKNMN
eukprot:scaffold1355_cov268-Pinguiococcus_pyrenoidosus.AAC.35